MKLNNSFCNFCSRCGKISAGRVCDTKPVLPEDLPVTSAQMRDSPSELILFPVFVSFFGPYHCSLPWNSAIILLMCHEDDFHCLWRIHREKWMPILNTFPIRQTGNSPWLWSPWWKTEVLMKSPCPTSFEKQVSAVRPFTGDTGINTTFWIKTTSAFWIIRSTG